MRVLGMAPHCELGDLYLRLGRDGHDVKVVVDDGCDVYQGLVDRVDRGAGLDWVGSDGIVVYEDAAHGAEQDALRREGFAVVGGSAVGDALEGDRAAAQDLLRGLGLRTAPTRRFASFDDALADLAAAPRRAVFKLNGAGWSSSRNYVGRRADGRDVAAVLRQQQRAWRFDVAPDFVLMDHVAGVEIGVGAWFDGARFLRPACIDVEHKRFFPGDRGELTGEMGTVVRWRGAERLFDRTLSRLAPHLAGHHGWVNLNLIANDDGLWPLELTMRFGYPGFAILSALHDCSWADVLRQVARGADAGAVDDADDFATAADWAVGLCLTVPPFPYSDGYERLSRGAPLFLDGGLHLGHRHLQLGEVRKDGDDLVCAGACGYVGVVTGVGATVDAARGDAVARAEDVVVANVRFRDDVGARFAARDQARLVALDLLPPETPNPG